jgi:hypothetical protein
MPKTFLARVLFLRWRWRRYVPPKRRFLQNPHGATSQKTAFFKFAVAGLVTKFLAVMKPRCLLSRKYCILGCRNVYFGSSLTFRRSILTPYLGSSSTWSPGWRQHAQWNVDEILPAYTAIHPRVSSGTAVRISTNVYCHNYENPLRK